MNRVDIANEAINVLLLTVLFGSLFGMYRFRGFEEAVLFGIGFIAYQIVSEDE